MGRMLQQKDVSVGEWASTTQVGTVADHIWQRMGMIRHGQKGKMLASVLRGECFTVLYCLLR